MNATIYTGTHTHIDNVDVLEYFTALAAPVWRTDILGARDLVVPPSTPEERFQAARVVIDFSPAVWYADGRLNVSTPSGHRWETVESLAELLTLAEKELQS